MMREHGNNVVREQQAAYAAEGETDRIALNALWASWQTRLGQRGWGIQIHPLDDKSRYFRKIGPRAAEKMVNNDHDLVVGLPDLYPNEAYSHTEFKHDDLSATRQTGKPSSRSPRGITAWKWSPMPPRRSGFRNGARLSRWPPRRQPVSGRASNGWTRPMRTRPSLGPSSP